MCWFMDIYQMNPARLFQLTKYLHLQIYKWLSSGDFKHKANRNIKVSDSLKPPGNIWVFRIIFECRRQKFINS